MWVCRAAYTILLKYAGIAAVHILFMVANISVPRTMQLTVTERVWVDNVKPVSNCCSQTELCMHNNMHFY